MKPAPGGFRFDLYVPAAGTPAEALARQLRSLPVTALPLQAGCVQGGWADPDSVQLSLIGAEPDHGGLDVAVMVYFEEIVGGCNCSEDPVRYPAALRLELLIAADGRIERIQPVPD